MIYCANCLHCKTKVVTTTYNRRLKAICSKDKWVPIQYYKAHSQLIANCDDYSTMGFPTDYLFNLPKSGEEMEYSGIFKNTSTPRPAVSRGTN